VKIKVTYLKYLANHLHTVSYSIYDNCTLLFRIGGVKWIGKSGLGPRWIKCYGGGKTVTFSVGTKMLKYRI